MFLNTYQASPAPERYQISIYRNTSPAPEKPGKYLKAPFRRRRSISTHFSGAGEVLIYTYLAQEVPEKPEKPKKYLYIPKLYMQLGLFRSKGKPQNISKIMLFSMIVEKAHQNKP